ncbi:MAG: hypothetical protein F6J94_24270 [Moorea sp. SIO1F2]|nr:hypothetical protein [Moorena sp. SIO1F2]NET84915.1 hypothetical protein [Moorena sp. SIO1F2]
MRVSNTLYYTKLRSNVQLSLPPISLSPYLPISLSPYLPIQPIYSV